jgi:hypothetical protein
MVERILWSRKHRTEVLKAGKRAQPIRYKVGLRDADINARNARRVRHYSQLRTLCTEKELKMRQKV